MKSKLAFVVSILFLIVQIPVFANGNEEESESAVEIGEVSDPMAKYKEPLTVSTYFEIEPPLSDYFSKDRIMNNIFQDKYLEELGILMEYKWFAAQSDEDSVQKKNIAIASGDIPDIMMVNKEQLALLARTDMINKDIGMYFEKYASDHLKEWMYQEGNGAMDSATFNGRVIAIPSTDSSIDTASFLWIRKDWLDNLSLDIPTTMDALYNVMLAFKNNDPDGNNIPDTYGLLAHKDILTQRGSADAGDILGLFNGFGAYPRAWIKKDGKIVYGSIQPEIRNALAFVNKLYNEELVEQDFAVKNLVKASELSASGKAGIQYGAVWNAMWPLQSSVDNDSNANWIPVAIPSATGKPGRPQVKLNIPWYYVVNKNAKHPEALIKLLNFFVEKLAYASPQEYEKYLVEDTGIPSFALHDTMFKIYNALKNIEAYRHVSVALDNSDTSLLNAEELSHYDSILKYRAGDLTMSGSAKTFGSGGAYKTMEYYYENDLFEMDQFFGAPTDLMKRRMQTIKDKEVEFFTKVIIGVESIDSFDDFVKELETIGLDQITDEVNDWYSNR